MRTLSAVQCPGTDTAPNSASPIFTTCLWLTIWAAGLAALVFVAGERLIVARAVNQPDAIRLTHADPGEAVRRDADRHRNDATVPTVDAASDTEKANALRQSFQALPQTRVNFHIASTELTARSQRVLDALAELMRSHDRVNLDITGHSDNYGFELANLYLSQTRAGSVRDYLITRGVSQYRMLARGFGESEPIADNTTEAGRARNRRIEFRFLEENRWN